MKEEDRIASVVVDHCHKIHQLYGPGLFESVYEKVLVYELIDAGYQVESQVPISLQHRNLHIDVAFRADLIVEGCVLVELKSVDMLPPAYYKQVVTYLRLTGLKLGLLVNFNAGLIKEGIRRIVNGL